MKNVTELLSDEHRNILFVIDGILAECDGIDSSKPVDRVYFEEAIDFIKNYADRFHHAKEEDVLFDMMNKNADLMHCNPISVMLFEHDEGRDFVRGMEQGLAGGDQELLLESARGYCMLLQQHIYKEDNILYPMAEEALTDQQKEEVTQAYGEVNARFSSEEVECYLRLVERAKKVSQQG